MASILTIRKSICIAVVTGLLCSAAHAQPIKPYTCRGTPTLDEDLRFSEVVADRQESIYFRSDVEGCPDGPACLTKAYLVHGDKLLVSERHPDWVCGWYFGKAREFVGWLPSRNIRPVVPPERPRLQDWVGVWIPDASDDEITIRRSRSTGAISIVGYATWRGGRNNDGVQVVHTGDFAGEAIPDGIHASVGEDKIKKDRYACVVRMQLVSGNLVVNDNSFCGGMNVRFNDVYRKRIKGLSKPKSRKH